jgi:(2Fe-2S) ferredoxin
MSLRSPIPPVVSFGEPIVKIASSSKPAIIKVCGKPDCMKQGGKALCKTLDKALSSGEWDPSIQVQFTGCMGKCSQGPNLVVMPDKKRYSNVTAQDIPKVLSQHFSASQTV